MLTACFAQTNVHLFSNAEQTSWQIISCVKLTTECTSASQVHLRSIESSFTYPFFTAQLMQSFTRLWTTGMQKWISLSVTVHFQPETYISLWTETNFYHLSESNLTLLIWKSKTVFNCLIQTASGNPVSLLLFTLIHKFETVNKKTTCHNQHSQMLFPWITSCKFIFKMQRQKFWSVHVWTSNKNL